MQSGRLWRSVAGALITLVAFPLGIASNAPQLQAATGGSRIAANHSNNLFDGAGPGATVEELPVLDEAVTSTSHAATTTQPVVTTVAAPATTTVARSAELANPNSDPSANTSLLVPLAVPRRGVSESLISIGRIKIAAVGVDETLREGIAQNVIDAGPAHWPGSAAPGGIGNAVIVGHRSTYSQPFHDLANLVVGDSIVFETVSGWRHTYNVERQFVVGSDAMWITEQSVGRHVTLFTCHPIGSSRQRLITVGVLAKSERLA